MCTQVDRYTIDDSTLVSSRSFDLNTKDLIELTYLVYLGKLWTYLNNANDI